MMGPNYILYNYPTGFDSTIYDTCFILSKSLGINSLTSCNEHKLLVTSKILLVGIKVASLFRNIENHRILCLTYQLSNNSRRYFLKRSKFPHIVMLLYGSLPIDTRVNREINTLVKMKFNITILDTEMGHGS